MSAIPINCINCWNRLSTLPHCCTAENRTWSLPGDFSNKTNASVAKGINFLRLTEKDTFCFSVPCNNKHTFLGNFICEDTPPLSPTQTKTMRINHWMTVENTFVSRYTTLNTTQLQDKIRGFKTTVKKGTHLLEVPSQFGMGTPKGYIWKCGHTFYFYLPKDW